MKSEWKVQSNYINGKVMYIPFRQLRKNEPLHSGNMEHHGEYLSSYNEAEKIVRFLNEREEGRE